MMVDLIGVYDVIKSCHANCPKGKEYWSYDGGIGKIRNGLQQEQQLLTLNQQ